MLSANISLVLQKVVLEPNVTNDVLFGSPAYWNHTLYFAPRASPLMAFPLSGGLLGTPLKTVASYAGGRHSPSISANGNSNGVLWVITGQLLAFDAVSLKLLYTTNQAPNGRDTLPPIGHFVTQTVTNGKVYVGTQHSLEAYGLFHVAPITGGNAAPSTPATTLAAPIQVEVDNPYNGQPDFGA